MRNKFIILFFLMFLISSPIIATSNSTILLNNMEYQSTYPIVIQKDIPYIALETFVDLTNSSIESRNPYKIILGNKIIKLNPEQTQIEVGNTKMTLNAPPLFINKTLYLPLNLLDCLDYPYTFENNTLSLSSSIPYSQNTDDYNRHSFLPSIPNVNKLPSYITNMLSTSSISKTLANSLEEKNYLAYMDTTHKQEVYNLLSTKLTSSPYNNIEVALRPLKLVNGQPVLSPYKTYPVSISIQKSDLSFLIGDHSPIQYDNIWATFMPSHSLTEIDLDKTIDTTIMRVLYQYYRDLSNLKDDEFFSPFYQITNTRTNSLIKQVYTSCILPDDPNPKTITHTYTLSVYRVHTTGKLTFVIDLIKN